MTSDDVLHEEWSDEDWSDDSDDEWNDDETSDVVACPHCGSEIYEDAVQCPVCGEYVTHSSAHTFAGRPRWYVVLGLLGIIATMIVLSGLWGWF